MDCSARVPGHVDVARRAAAVFALVLACSLLSAPPARAEPVEKYAAIVVDALTGETIHSRHADAPRYPASLTKIMTLFVLFEEIEAGRTALNSDIRVSKYASQRPPSKIGFKPGQTIKVEDAIKALVTKSANDVAVAVAEHVSGSESAFARRMTQTAKRLGMHSTTFKNASGLPDRHQKTTARDMARLGMAVQQRFPRLYAFFQLKSFAYRGRSYRNHNRLLGSVAGVDGIKTGYIRASGFNLVSSVRRGDRHIVAVVMGGRTGASRNAHMTELINTHIKKASRGDVRQLFALSAVERFVRSPVPRAKPYGVLLASVIERSMLSGPEWEAASASLVDDFAGVREPRRTRPATVVAAAGPVMPVSEPVKKAVARDRLADLLADAAEDASRVPVSVGSLAQGSMGGGAAVEPVKLARTARPKRPAVSEDQAVLAYADDPFDRVFSQIPSIEVGSSDAIGESASQPPLKLARAEADAPAPAIAPGGPVPSGWHIQLGAVESTEEASAMLAGAKQAFPKILGDHEPYLMTVESAGVTLYRARFVGFASQQEARNACAHLAKARRSCWAEAM